MYMPIIMNAKLIPDCESPIRFYLELSPNCRYIFENGSCIGHYDPKLDSVI